MPVVTFVVTSALLTACSDSGESNSDTATSNSEGTKDRTTEEDSNASAPSLEDVNEAVSDLDGAIDEYLAIGTPTRRPIDAFFDEAESLLADARSAYEEWRSLFEQAVSAGNAPEDEVERYGEYAGAVEAWLDAQDEQAVLSRQCFNLVTSERTAAASECYVQILEEHGDEWQATADRLNEFQREGL